MLQRAAVLLPGFNSVHHKARFVEIVEGAVQRNRLAVGAVGPQLFAQPTVVVFNQGVGSAENIAGRAIVLLQADGFRAGEVVKEALNVLDLRAAPAIDRLIVIADDHHLAGIARQQADPGVLNVVGILEFIDEDIGEALAVVLQDMRFVQPQLVGAQQQLGEVHQPGAVAGFLIGLIDLLPGLLDRIAVALNMMRAQPFIFLAVDVPHRLARRPLFLIEVHRLNQTLQQTQLVFAVEDLKVLRQVGIQMVRAQQTVRQAVEGAHPHAALGGAHQLADTVTHLRRRFVGKGHRHNGIRGTVLHAQQPGDTVHQNARLTTARPCQNQHIGARGRYGFTLFVIKAVEQVRNVHWHRRKRRGSTNPC